jgi:trimeric autotransporter adhesin
MSQIGQYNSLGRAIETVTGNAGGAVGPNVATGNINLLGVVGITVTGVPATNTLTISGAGLAGSFVTDAGTATPAAGVLNVIGGSAINTAGAANNLTINLDDSPQIVGNLLMNNTNVAGTVGEIMFGGNRWISNIGTDNTFVGQNSGNTTLTTATATENTGIGATALTSLTTGTRNTALGDGALGGATTGSHNTGLGFGSSALITTGSDNIGLGYLSLLNLVTGVNNIAIGSSAGTNYTGAEGSNIVISNSGTNGESNVIRLGTDGNGVGQQNQTFIAGTVTTARDITATTGSISTINGDVIVGNTAAAVTSPIVDFKKSRTGGVITSGDIIGTLNFRGIGTGVTYVTGASITSTSSGTIAANRVASNLVFATHPDAASGLTPTTRMTIAPTGEITIAAPDSGTALTITAGGETITAGDMTLSAGNINIAATTTSALGNVVQAGTRLLHTFGTSNLFLGAGAGNYTLTGNTNVGIGGATGSALTSGIFNTVVGNSALQALTSGSNNTALGAASLQALTTSNANVAIGLGALQSLVTGATNIAIGVIAGVNYTGAESDNIIIGNMGTLGESGVTRIGTAGTQTQTFISGTVNTQLALTVSSGNATLTNGSVIVGNTVAGAGASDVDFLKSRTGGAITSGDALGLITFQGHDGTGYTIASQITSTNSGTVAASRVASDLKFYTHPDSVTASTLRMTIAPTGAITIATPDSGVGLTVSGGGETITAGDLALTAGNLTLANTNSGGTAGVILWNAESYIHNFTNGGTNCFFAGRLAGNIGVTATGSAQTGIGYFALGAVTSGSNNTALGAAALGAITTPSNNVAVGATALSTITTGAGNIAVGTASGSSLTGADSNNIMIGHVGAAGNGGRIRIGTNGTHTTCFITGIDTVNVGSVAKVVTMASDQLGTATITAGANITVTPGANTITIASTASGGGLTWAVTTVNANLVANNGYIANKAGLLTMTLPAVAAVGDTFRITGINTAVGWRIAQNAGQTIFIGTSTSTPGAGGYIEATAIRDSVEIVCVVANNDFNVISSIGNITVV